MHHAQRKRQKTAQGKHVGPGHLQRQRAEHVADGPVVATFKAMVEQMFQGAATAKGALIITPETVVVTMPGAENKKVL